MESSALPLSSHAATDLTAGTCCICLEEVDYRGTALVQCSRCAITVHVKCYGKTVPTDGSKWFCEPCSFMVTSLAPDEKPRVQPYCIVCPSGGGALRETNQPGVWCHVLCMNWIPELSHSLAAEMNEKLDIRLLDRSRESLKCLICGQRGGCIQCISGRCARSFHVICAMRSPSDLIFTGYNNENQQVYHCKTHLSDIATFKYEMVDNSWRRSPSLLKYLRETPESSGKCRVCQNKIPAIHQERHETQCLLGWLTREEFRIRKVTMAKLGVQPIAINYGAAANGKSAVGTRLGTPSKSKKNGPAMRQCADCGEQVRETLMMGHMKNRCTRSREHTQRAKRPNSMKRKSSATTSSDVVDLIQDDVGPVALDLSDVLFATWPGQSAGSLLDSTNFWRIVNNNFFSTKILLKKRIEQLCKNLCGAKLEDIGNFVRKTNSHDAVSCADVVLFNRLGGPSNALELNSIVHRCDFMMRNSRMRCVDDLFAKPMISIDHRPSETVAPSSASAEYGSVRATFRNTDGQSVDCRFGIKLESSGVVFQPGCDVWSRFHHDSVSTLAGASLENNKLPRDTDLSLWVSLLGFDGAGAPIDPTGEVSTLSDVDELTPEINLLVEKLREQMHHNRYRMRTLCRITQRQDHQEGVLERVRMATETYYNEFSLWKALCKSLLVGYREFWRITMDEVTEKPESGESSPKADGEDGEEAVDDGTCVVCFDGQSPESNPIIFCDRCDLAVHQRCYGIQRVPSNEFYCDRCRLEDDGHDPVVDVYCQLCPLRDGAFKRTIDGKWVHVVCALWCPGVWIGDLQTLSGIKLVDYARTTRFTDMLNEVNSIVTAPKSESHKSSQPRGECLQHGSLCRYCRVACGRTIRCCHAGCGASFHPLCAWFEGLPMTIRLSAEGYVYSGGGSGLCFKMLCGNHLPSDYPAEMQLNQRKNRRRFRIDSFFVSHRKIQATPSTMVSTPAKDEEDSVSQWDDQELCGACFEFASLVPSDTAESGRLNKKQLMMRCQYCNTFIHPVCSLTEVEDISDLFQSNWICERCTQLGREAKSAATGCVVCDRSSDYMMPCIAASTTEAAPNVVSSQNGLKDGTIASSSNSKWMHVFCAKMTKSKLSRRHHVLSATLTSSVQDTSGKCDICNSRGRNLASCSSCSKRFHPTCAARKKFYINRSNKTDWKFYCGSHSPPHVAYDEARQSWFTSETLAHLQELRHILERGRMIVEMARQRDRQKKRMLNLCSLRRMELSVEMVLKKRPSSAMKETFESMTGEVMVDAPRRAADISQGNVHRKSVVGGRTSSRLGRGITDMREASNAYGSLKRQGDLSELENTPQKRRRISAAEESELSETPSRRSSRRSLVLEDGEVSSKDITDSRTTRGARLRVPINSDEGLTKRRNTPREVKHIDFCEELLNVTRSRRDFDGVIEKIYPELVESD